MRGTRIIDKETIRNFMLLYALAKMGAYHKPIRVSTTTIADKIGLSQQSVSRHLISLEEKGLIHRTISKEGSLIRISKAGGDFLRCIYIDLSAIFKGGPRSITLEGEVFTGLGEGAYYVAQEGYRRQFVEKLGFDPYPGTLNLKISDGKSMMLRATLDIYPGIEIKGFRNKNRTFGPVKCFLAIIGGRERGAVVIAERSHYSENVLEVIAPIYLREKLGLKDGDKVKVEIFI
ncbi:MAG: DUF120 domain-containing protein [Candidatus Bathyarchaeia archaeon]